MKGYGRTVSILLAILLGVLFYRVLMPITFLMPYLIFILLFVPFYVASFDDGGTRVYGALTYKAVAWKKIYSTIDHLNEEYNFNGLWLEDYSNYEEFIESLDKMSMRLKGKTKERIDYLHRINQFKLQLMPVFDPGI